MDDPDIEPDDLEPDESQLSAGYLTSDGDVEASLRPQSLDDFIGQPRVREQLALVLRGAKQRGGTPDHVLLSGPPGLGKTSMAMIIAGELGTALRITSGPALERAGDLAAMLSNLVEGDVLFIDSTHALKIDGDVSYLYLEILPRLNKGVIVHIHDIPFPYNTPFPPETWVFERGWPVFWTEAMLLQSFLCHNSEFQIRLSLPLIRFNDEEFLRQSVSGYDHRKGTGPDTFSSIWLERI